MYQSNQARAIISLGFPQGATTSSSTILSIPPASFPLRDHGAQKPSGAHHPPSFFFPRLQPTSTPW